MRYTSLLVALLSSLAAAQNAFTMTSLSTITAGTPYNITWAPSAATATVTLYLRQGNSEALTTVATIASSIPNSGSYLWTPSPSLVAGNGYAFEIVDSSNPNINNYSGQFTLDSTNTVSAASSGTASASGSTSAMSASSASTSGVTVLTGTSSGMTSMTTGSANSTGSVNGTSSAATGSSSVTGKTSSASAGSKTSTGTSTGTSTSAPGATGNAATALKAGGAVLGLVGMVMAAL